MTSSPTVVPSAPPPIRRLEFPDGRVDSSLEWLVTNGLGGYASAPVGGGLTRRYHSVLIAALPAPFGRMVMVNHVRATAIVDGRRIVLDHENLQHGGPQDAERAHVVEFQLEAGL